MSQLNRRTTLTLVATLPTLAVPSARAATMPASFREIFNGSIADPLPNPDQELIELGRRFDVLERQFHETDEKMGPKNDALVRILRETAGPRSDEDYNEIWRRLDQEFGPDPEPSCDDLSNAIGPLERAIMALPAFTFAGLGVKARIARFECSHFYDETDDDADWDHWIARELISSVLAAAELSATI